MNAVAELALMEVLVTLRKLINNDPTIRNGEWKKEHGTIFIFKKIGIIGFWKVGKKLPTEYVDMRQGILQVIEENYEHVIRRPYEEEKHH